MAKKGLDGRHRDTTGRVASRLSPQASQIAECGAAASSSSNLPKSQRHFLELGNAMEFVWDIFVSIAHAIEQILIYVETHHWIFGFLAGGYIFYLHDRAIHARFDALDKRVDEIRKRLAIEY